MRISDWSSDVCSSDLEALARLSGDLARTQAEHAGAIATASRLAVRTELANGLSPALDTLRDGMAGLSASVTAIARDMMPGLDRLRADIGRAACRGRVCQYL